jgi:type III secretion protein F
MLDVQFKLQQFSTAVSLHSATIKLIKDTLMGIIAKIA